jgi:menaquinone-dependent protoporphyrinogen oxidase
MPGDVRGYGMSAVLVAYATKHGSTREVAEAVAAVLGEAGADVSVRAAADVKDVEGFAAVVLGGSLYYFRWHRDARRFLSRHRDTLSGLPVAIFALGPIEDTAEQYEGARNQLDRALGKASWLSPVSVAVFGGQMKPSEQRNPAMKKMPPSDLRDWEVIRAWAGGLVDALGVPGRR